MTLTTTNDHDDNGEDEENGWKFLLRSLGCGCGKSAAKNYEL
jgi:hypothetical protein